MIYQSFEEWQKSPIQGAIPFPPSVQDQIDQRCPCMAQPASECRCEPAPNPELTEVSESLATATSWLENTYCLIGVNGLSKRYERLYLSICDSLHSAKEAMERLEDEPDEE